MITQPARIQGYTLVNGASEIFDAYSITVYNIGDAPATLDTAVIPPGASLSVTAPAGTRFGRVELDASTTTVECAAVV